MLTTQQLATVQSYIEDLAHIQDLLHEASYLSSSNNLSFDDNGDIDLNLLVWADDDRKIFSSHTSNIFKAGDTAIQAKLYNCKTAIRNEIFKHQHTN